MRRPTIHQFATAVNLAISVRCLWQLGKFMKKAAALQSNLDKITKTAEQIERTAIRMKTDRIVDDALKKAMDDLLSKKASPKWPYPGVDPKVKMGQVTRAARRLGFTDTNFITLKAMQKREPFATGFADDVALVKEYLAYALERDGADLGFRIKDYTE